MTRTRPNRPAGTINKLESSGSRRTAHRIEVDRVTTSSASPTSFLAQSLLMTALNSSIVPARNSKSRAELSERASSPINLRAWVDSAPRSSRPP